MKEFTSSGVSDLRFFLGGLYCSLFSGAYADTGLPEVNNCPFLYYLSVIWGWAYYYIARSGRVGELRCDYPV